MKSLYMKSVLGWLLVTVLLVGGGGSGLWLYRSTVNDYTYRLELQEIKKGFQQKMAGLHQLDADAYRREIGIALTRYFSDIDKLARKYPDSFDLDRERKLGEAELERGRMTEARKLAREERIDITKDLLQRMRTGQYRALYTAADNGFRFDIYDVTPEKVSGEDRVKFSYVHWGAFGPVDYDSIVGNMRAKREKGRPVEIPQIVADNAPPSLQIQPERWIREFIPGVEIGFYDLPQFPRRASSLSLTFIFGIRTVGGTRVDVRAVFPEIPISESWKVPEGQKWQAQERFADEKELQAAGGKPVP